MGAFYVFLYVGFWGSLILSVEYFKLGKDGKGAIFFYLAVFHLVLIALSFFGVIDANKVLGISQGLLTN